MISLRSLGSAMVPVIVLTAFLTSFNVQSSVSPTRGGKAALSVAQMIPPIMPPFIKHGMRSSHGNGSDLYISKLVYHLMVENAHASDEERDAWVQYLRSIKAWTGSGERSETQHALVRQLDQAVRNYWASKDTHHYDQILAKYSELVTSTEGNHQGIVQSIGKYRDEVKASNTNSSRSGVLSAYSDLVKTYSDKVDGRFTGVKDSLGSLADAARVGKSNEEIYGHYSGFVEKYNGSLRLLAASLSGDASNRPATVETVMANAVQVMDSARRQYVMKPTFDCPGVAVPSATQSHQLPAQRVEAVDPRAVKDHALKFMEKAMPSATAASDKPLYNDDYAPSVISNVMKAYLASDDYVHDAQTVQVFYDNRTLNPDDARTVMENRDPVNIAMGRHFDTDKLEQMTAELQRNGTFHNSDGVKNTGSAFLNPNLINDRTSMPFSNHPNTVSVYSETPIWLYVNNNYSPSAKRKIAVLSVPAPALDSPKQPHFNHYVQNDAQGKPELRQHFYRQEMEHLFDTIILAAKNNKTTAFGGVGLKSVTFSGIGQSAFLEGLIVRAPGHQGQQGLQGQQGEIIDDSQARIAHGIFLEVFARKVSEARQSGGPLHGLKIFLTPGIPKKELIDASSFDENAFLRSIGAEKTKVGIGGPAFATAYSTTVEEHTLMVNAWDPHSLPGNGNDGDRSVDGALGSSTAMLYTQSPMFNLAMKNKGVSNYVPVHPASH